MRIAKALADPTRFSILARIAAEPDMACQRLIEEFAVTPATMSHHLKELGGADLVEMRARGQVRLSHPARGHVQRLSAGAWPSPRRPDETPPAGLTGLGTLLS